MPPGGFDTVVCFLHGFAFHMLLITHIPCYIYTTASNLLLVVVMLLKHEEVLLNTGHSSAAKTVLISNMTGSGWC